MATKKKKPPPPPPTPKARTAKPAAPARPMTIKPAFPKKNQPPTPLAFAAQLPLTLGKRLDLVRAFLVKQKAVREDVYFYGPESGWALRYLHDGRPLCSLHVHDARPVGIVSLEAAAAGRIDWKTLSATGRKARQQAHGSPSLLWLDVPLEGGGAEDFKSILRAKIDASGQPARPSRPSEPPQSSEPPQATDDEEATQEDAEV